MKTRFEVRQEGVLIFLFVDGEAKECTTMHEIGERQRLLIKADSMVRAEHSKENQYRKLYRGSAVTLESFAAKVACRNICDFMFWDGSKTHPLMWPVLALEEEKQAAASAIL